MSLLRPRHPLTRLLRPRSVSARLYTDAATKQGNASTTPETKESLEDIQNLQERVNQLKDDVAKLRKLSGKQPASRDGATQPSQPVTGLAKIIQNSIKATGPISFSTYMHLCLGHPTHGYYTSSENVLGSQGDFITSPEISQLFGEIIAAWLLTQWGGSTKKIRIVELGPGRGTLMDDILNVFSAAGIARSASLDVHLVETSPVLRAMQEKKLSKPNYSSIKLHWHDTFLEVPPSPDQYTILIAHEFFDALPFHLIEKRENQWHEVMIDYNREQEGEQEGNAGSSSTSMFRPVLSPGPSPTATVLGMSSSRFRDLPDGTQLEVSPASYRAGKEIGDLLRYEEGVSGGGCGLVIDYGAEHAFANSFRAFSKHKQVDFFDQPGTRDLTVNVDFAYLKEALQSHGSVNAHGPISQREFLINNGMEVRRQFVSGKLPDEKRTTYNDGASRLVDPDGMGEQYKFLGITDTRTKTVWPFGVPPSE